MVHAASQVRRYLTYYIHILIYYVYVLAYYEVKICLVYIIYKYTSIYIYIIYGRSRGARAQNGPRSFTGEEIIYILYINIYIVCVYIYIYIYILILYTANHEMLVHRMVHAASQVRICLVSESG